MNDERSIGRVTWFTVGVAVGVFITVQLFEWVMGGGR